MLGILGALSDRLDLELVRRAALAPQVGTFLIAGPVQVDPIDEPWVLDPKVIIAGRIAHDQMHRYAGAMQAALIPYSDTSLNYHCSPLRLYDHLATGVPIYAQDTCDQIKHCEAPGLIVRSREEILDAIATGLDTHRYNRPISNYLWDTRGRALLEAISTAGARHSKQEDQRL